MAVIVVDHLEVAEIEQHERELGIAATGPCQLPCELKLQRAWVGQACEAVFERLLLGLLEDQSVV